MTVDECKAFLCKARELNDSIYVRQQRAETLRARAAQAVFALSGDRVKSSALHNPMEECMCKALDLAAELECDRVRLDGLRVEIGGFIARLRGDAAILEDYYLYFMTTEQISRAMGYSPRHIRRLREAAVKRLAAM